MVLYIRAVAVLTSSKDWLEGNLMDEPSLISCRKQRHQHHAICNLKYVPQNAGFSDQGEEKDIAQIRPLESLGGRGFEVYGV